jgi:amino acid adenylation domain-containing protein
MSVNRVSRRAARADAADFGIPAARPRRRYPVSFAQERMWLLQHLDPQSVAYNTVTGLRLRGPLEPERLRDALTQVVARQEILRTTFQLVAGGPRQVIDPPRPARLEVLDVRDDPAAPERFVREQLREVFDLQRGPVFRAHLLRTAPDEHLFVFVLHHIAGDAWSCAVFFRELAACYAAEVSGEPAPLPPLPIQYRDFAAWQRARLRGAQRETELAYWRDQLDGAPRVLELPADHVRPPAQSGAGARQRVTIDPATQAGIRELARRRQTTPFVVMLAAFEILLWRYTGMKDLLVGTPVANRMFPEIQGLIGYFANTLAIRARIDEALTFQAFLAAQHQTCMGALGAQELPFEQLVSALHVERDASRQPLAQVAFAFEHDESADVAWPSLAVETVEFDGGMTTFDLAMMIQQRGESVQGWIKYRTDLFAAPTIEAMARAYSHVLALVIANPAVRLDEVSLTDRQPVPGAAAPSAAFTETAEWSLVQRIDTWAEAQPEAVAITDGRRQMTWSELRTRTRRLARRLSALGADPDAIVGVCLDDPLQRIVAIVSILEAGAAYLPLDAGLPPGRLEWILGDARPRVIVTTEPLAARLTAAGAAGRLLCLDRDAAAIDGGADTRVRLRLHDEHLAYVMYTSGSTGRPKGVQLTRRGMAHIAQVQRDAFRSGPGSQILQFASIGFDASVFEILMALAHGGTLHVASRDELLPGQPLRRTLEQRRITHALLPPSALATIEHGDGLRLECLVVGGEACSEAVARTWAPRLRLFNAYGPTEVTIYGTVAAIEPGFERVTIGRAIDRTTARVVDERFRPVPVGVPGEILLGGAGLARGYNGRPDLTAERFIPDPFSTQPGARLYRTGDLGKLQADGSIEYAGRTDQQVKLRGHRIELAEIESVLGTLAGVAECVVLLGQGPANGQELIAYIKPAPGVAVNPGDVRQGLKQQLPDYMVPAAFVMLDEFPRTTSGKPDRTALRATKVQRARGAGPAPAAAAAPTELERLVQEIWTEMFGGAPIGRDQNFFDLGGNSLLVLRVQTVLEQRLGRRVPTLELFRQATVARLASYLAGGGEADGSPGDQQAQAVHRRLAFQQQRARRAASAAGGV